MQSETKPLPGLGVVANLMTRVGFLETQIEGRGKDESYFAGIEPVALGLFRMVVMGEIKKGKSSFINALCGTRDLVPVHDNVATSTIFKIHYGESRGYSVFFLPETGKPKLEIPTEELFAYGTEDGNPDNRKGVDFIGVSAPSQVLRDGVVLIDTPGVGGLFKKHRDITFRYAPKADAVFFVTDSVESPIGAEEIDFLKELRRITPLVYFVQTKGAEADPETRRRRMENNIAILTAKVGIPAADIRYFIVDSNLKMEADARKSREDLEDSGFQPLMAYLHQVLKPARDRNIGTAGLRRAATKLAEIRSVVEKRKIVLDADTADKQAALAEELKEAEGRMAAWNNEVRPQLVKEFQVRVQAIQSEITTTFREKLRVGGEISEEVGAALARCKEMEPEEIYQLAAPLANEARSKASELMLQTSEELETRFTRLMEALAIKAGASMSTTSLNKLDITDQDPNMVRYANARLEELTALGEESRFFEKARTVVYGGMAGSAIAFAVGSIIGSVVPVFGTFIGGTVGLAIASIWGGQQAYEIARVKESAAARDRVHRLIEQDLSSILVQIEAGFSRIFNDLRSKAEDALGEMVKTSLAELVGTRASLQERMRASSKEIGESRQKFQTLQGQIEGLQGELDAMNAMLAE